MKINNNTNNININNNNNINSKGTNSSQASARLHMQITKMFPNTKQPITIQQIQH